MNEQFQSITGIDFTTAQPKSKEINVKKQKPKAEEQKIRRQTARKILFDIQEAKSNTKVIRYTYRFFYRVEIGWKFTFKNYFLTQPS